MTVVAVVAAHPDDEALGCGGTLARHAARGDEVHVLFLADGVAAREGAARAEIAQRQDAARSAMRVMGAREPHFGGFPDNRMDTVPLLEVVQVVETFLSKAGARVIYTHHGGDLNIDHRVAHAAVVTACRPVPGSIVDAVYTFEVLSSTEWHSPQQTAPFVPQQYVDVTATLDKKLKALRCYGAEMRAGPHARSYDAVQSLARLRGAQAGVAAAEAFEVLRRLVRT